MTQPLPSSAQAIASVRGNMAYILPIWQRWFNSFTSSPLPVVPVVPGPSPFEILALNPGSYFISGGTVSNISISRGSTVISTGMTSGFIPVGSSDIVTVTYTVTPTIQFIPA